MVGAEAIIAGLLVAGCVALVLLLRIGSADSDGGFVTIREFPALVSALQTSGRSGAFWVVLIPGTARADGCTANLQYSLEDGVLGVDWVLLANRNLEDKDQFLQCFRGAGAHVEEKQGRNGVRYLRATGPFDLVRVGQAFLTAVYGVKVEDPLELIIMGFDWRKTPSAERTI